jgi:glyoxylase-like metal-dependent hydrolase (beta-lactamase superfamily II)
MSPRLPQATCLLALALLCCSGERLSAAGREASIVPLADGAWLLPGTFERGRQPDGNSLLLQGPKGLVVVDTGRHAEHSAAVLAWAQQRAQPLRVVINTHWHLDHLGGNAALRAATPGLRVLASAAVRDAVATRMPASEVELKGLLADPATDATTRRIVDIDLALYAVREALRPDELIAGAPQDLAPAGRRVQVGVETGVSGGDVWVLDRASGILAVGDFVTLPVPFFDTACAEQWRAALARLDALPYERILPGHGPLMSRQEFGRYRLAFGRLLECAAGPAAPADCAAGWAADLGPLLPAGSQRVVAGMLSHYIGQRLRVDAAESRRFCTG